VFTFANKADVCADHRRLYMQKILWLLCGRTWNCFLMWICRII